MSKLKKLLGYLRNNPEDTTANIAQKFDTSKRHVRRARAQLRKEAERPKILLLDIETMPMMSLTWGLYKQYINHEAIVKDWSVGCWCAKWLGSNEIIGRTNTGEQCKDREDSEIIADMHALMDDADIIIAHNGDGFDLPKLNTRFLKNGLSPTSPYQTIDTLKVCRKHFSFANNKLDNVARELGLPRKANNEYDWWYDAAVHGSDDGINKIYKYCHQDIWTLEEVYYALRPWIKSHPNIGLYSEGNCSVCPNCGSDDLIWGNYYYTMVGKYSAFRCNNCGAIGRNRITILNADEREQLVTSVAR
jgi:hypothetical protein